MKHRLWMTGTLFILATVMVGAAQADTPGNWAISLVALVALVAIEAGIAGRGFADRAPGATMAVSTTMSKAPGSSGSTGAAPSPTWWRDAPMAS